MALQDPSTLTSLPGDEDDELCEEMSEAATVTLGDISPVLRGAYLNLFSNLKQNSDSQEDGI